LRVYYAPKRANMAGFLQSGANIQSIFPLGIPPPGQPGFQSFPPGVVGFGFGKLSTASNSIPGLALTLNVFAHWGHQHYIGARIWTDVYANVNNFWQQKARLGSPNIPYDFTRQQVDLVNPPVQITTGGDGDSVVTMCQWDSTHKTTFTQFGLDSEQEMCESLLFVYPIPLNINPAVQVVDSSGVGFLFLNGTGPINPRVCCLPDGSAQVLALAQCQNNGGVFQDTEVTISATSCQRACCSSSVNGQCSIQTKGACGGDFWMGLEAMSCGSTTCPVVPPPVPPPVPPVPVQTFTVPPQPCFYFCKKRHAQAQTP